MDYNDNDYDSQNLHLGGEESSKVASVLRPFALPKFDFDDSLHGHLRFDSLVENEVFLGISSQEDNQWIEDFSRGGSGIEFSSSATEPCALPRRNNVWSEATSSESVEMLLKAVRQEEMVPGENIIKESDPGGQGDCSTRQMENNLREEGLIDDVDSGNPLLPSTEVQEFSRSNQRLGTEGVQSEDRLEAQDTTVSSYGVCTGSKESSLTLTDENLNIDMKRTGDNQGETNSLVNQPVCNQVQENLSAVGIETDSAECSSLKIADIVQESVHQDKTSDASSLSSNCIGKDISDAVEEQKKGGNKNDEISTGSAAETHEPEMHGSLEISAKVEASKEEHEVVMCAANVSKASSMPEECEPVPTDNCSELVPVVSSSGTGIKQLESHNISPEKSSSSLQEEGCIYEGLGIIGAKIDTPMICGNAEWKQIPVIQPSDQLKNNPGSDNSLQTSHVNSESSMLHEIPGIPSENNSEKNISNADGPVISSDSTSPGFCHDEKSVTDDMKDARDTSTSQKDNIEGGDHLLPSQSVQTCGDNIVSMQVDVHESDLDVSACGEVDKQLPVDSSDMRCDVNEKETASALPGHGVNVDVGTAIGSQLTSGAGDYTVLNTEVEDTKLASSCSQGDDPHSCDTEYRDDNKETESETVKESSTLVSKDSLESSDILLGAEKTSLLDSAAAGGPERSDAPVTMIETSSVSEPDGACKELNKKMEFPASDLIVQEDCTEVASTGKAIETEIVKSTGTITVSVASHSADTAKANPNCVPGTNRMGLSPSEINNQESPRRKSIENIGEDLSTSMNSGVNALSKEEGTFTFDVRPLGGQSTGDSGKDLHPFPGIQACKLSLTGDGAPSTCGSSPLDPTTVKEISRDSSVIPDGCPQSGGPAGPSERKSRRGSGKSAKRSAKKGSQVKETTALKQTEKGGKSAVSMSPLATGRLMTFESVMKQAGSVAIATSSLPDLNTSTPPSAFFQQPFTDLQQVQLRAQIFVYGSLIQGAAPDESCMVSAFDGGRSSWEPSWRACVERLHGQKSQGNIETPVHSRSGIKVPDQTNRPSFPQSEVAGRASNIATRSPVVNPMIPLSSPLWSISTPSCEPLPSSSMVKGAVLDYQAVSPLHPYQTPPIRNFVAQTTWPSQSPFQVPWLASSQSSPFDISSKYSAFPITEPVKLTAVKESSLPTTSGTKHVSPIPATLCGPTTSLAGASSIDLKRVGESTSQTDKKARKRKKSSRAEETVQISVTAPLVDTVSTPVVANQVSKMASTVADLSRFSVIVQNQANSKSTPVVSSHYSTMVAVTTPTSLVPKSTTNQFLSLVSPAISTDQISSGDLRMDKRALNSESFSKVEEAKLQAQEAAAHAASAINCCESVWSKLDQQKNSGLPSDAESKLASASVALAAASSVAKAAAAAANIASRAAIQAKQMADEAITKYGTSGDQNDDSSSAISAAREAARKKVEAASAAAKHAENLDAIVKAAELAAEAVSHAGKIVTMGDPFSLSQLVEDGLHNYWKVSQVTSEPGPKRNDMNKSKPIENNTGEVPKVLLNHVEPDKGMGVTSLVVSPNQKELSGSMVDDPGMAQNNLAASVKHGAKNLPKKGKSVPDLSTTAGGVSEPDIELISNSYIPNSHDVSSMKEGSLVEVLKDHGDVKRAWFSATILSLKDSKAIVSYTELQSDEGSEPLKECVYLEAKDGEAPRVRIPHPTTDVRFEGTRKRRRAAVKDYAWAVGDRVDAWVKDCWREGVVAEKNKKDATALSVHFPAEGETLMVKLWHLRPTVIWSGNQWIEWCRPGSDVTSQGDTPVEKRQKVGSRAIETEGKGKIGASISFTETGRNEKSRLPLSANEKVFSIGSARDVNKSNMARTARSGLEKEGSRVVFGVPKPGKKRKFMEVSKHYVSDRSTKINDSIKLAKLKNNSKLGFKEKPVAQSKPKTVRSGKPPSIPSRRLPQKDDSASSQPNSRDASLSDHTKGSISNDEIESGEQNLAESSSKAEKTAGRTMVFSSQAAQPRKTRFERLNQGKLAPAPGKSAKSEANEKPVSENTEPRRSIRRIQPTSRLLEGLQSSITISKIGSSSSHDRSQRIHSKGTTRGH